MLVVYVFHCKIEFYMSRIFLVVAVNWSVEHVDESVAPREFSGFFPKKQKPCFSTDPVRIFVTYPSIDQTFNCQNNYLFQPKVGHDQRLEHKCGHSDSWKISGRRFVFYPCPKALLFSVSLLFLFQLCGFCVHYGIDLFYYCYGLPTNLLPTAIQRLTSSPQSSLIHTWSYRCWHDPGSIVINAGNPKSMPNPWKTLKDTVTSDFAVGHLYRPVLTLGGGQC